MATEIWDVIRWRYRVLTEGNMGWRATNTWDGDIGWKATDYIMDDERVVEWGGNWNIG
jgi:hypothetical protein